MAGSRKSVSLVTPDALLEPTAEDEPEIQRVVDAVDAELRSRRTEYATELKLSVDAKFFGKNPIVADEAISRFREAGWEVIPQPIRNPKNYSFKRHEASSSTDPY